MRERGKNIKEREQDKKGKKTKRNFFAESFYDKVKSKFMSPSYFLN